MCEAKDHPNHYRCPENVLLRRARQTRHYALSKERLAASGLPDNPLTPIEPEMTRQRVTDAIERAREALKAAEDTKITYPEWPDSPVTKPGARLTRTGYEEGEGGWEYATDEGRQMEAAVREAGAAVASRAEVLTAERMAQVGQSPELLEHSDDGFSSAEEFKEFIDRKVKDAEVEFVLAGELHRADRSDRAAEDRYESAYQEVRRLQAHQGRIARGEGEYDMAVARIRAEGYREALAEQRSMGPRNGSVEVHPDSSKKAVARLEQALEYYPTDWIDADKVHEAHWISNGIWGEQEHNQRIPLLVRDAKMRQRTTMMGGTEKYEERASYSHAKALDLNEPVEGEVRKQITMKARVPKGARVARTYWESKDYRGRWSQVPEPSDRERELYGDMERIGEYRQRREIVMEGGTEKRSVVASELVIDSAREGSVDQGVSTAIHEYGHRAERVEPRVNDLMHTFIARRTTEGSGKRAPLEPLGWSERAREMQEKGTVPTHFVDWDELPKGLGRGVAEFTRSDGFANTYMGKQTSDQSSEAFTMGMESVFAGRNGGLVGDGGHRVDHEHRDLILGTLATVGRRD